LLVPDIPIVVLFVENWFEERNKANVVEIERGIPDDAMKESTRVEILPLRDANRSDRKIEEEECMDCCRSNEIIRTVYEL
jgi:hypothetical protein